MIQKPALCFSVSPACNPRQLALSLFLSTSFASFAAGGGAAAYLKKDASWYLSEEGQRITTNILSFQSDLGGWPKNTDTVDKPYKGKREDLHPTFDNSATTDELRFLARSYNATHEESRKQALIKGFGYILKAQYPTGGWPQYYPPSKQYHRYITFNDNSMVRLLEFLREVSRSEEYAFLPIADRKAAGAAFDQGIACILKCQIRVDGKPTVWCAQHDEIDYSPQKGRAYELASFSGSESVGITRLLMSLENPSPEIRASIEGAVSWFESAKITGIRLDKNPKSPLENSKDLIVVSDPSAPPLWARFYDLKTQKPFFCDRDSIPKATLAEIGSGRRNGYSWYGQWPASLLEKDYPAWKTKHTR
ncbi:MAG: pectate lyase [Luteolibacter sp.]